MNAAYKRLESRRLMTHRKVGKLHVFIDRDDPTTACVLFQRGEEWQLVSWDLSTNTTKPGQWLMAAKVQIELCALYRGLFVCTYNKVHDSFKGHQVLSRAPYFTALLHFESSCTRDFRVIKHRKRLKVAVCAEDMDRLTRYAPADMLAIDAWGLAEIRKSKRLVQPGPPSFSSKTKVAPSSGQHLGKSIRIDGARLLVDGQVVVDLTDATFTPVPPPAGYLHNP